jgi:Polyketide cyclase / dehydrase and lipid transport
MQPNSLDWREVHRTYSRWGLTDPHAPVQASGEISIDADQRRVWDVLTDVGAWQRLRADIDSVSVDGPVRDGTTCVLETTGVVLVLTFGLVVAPREINWTTSTATPGLVMTNRYVVIPQKGSTRVVSRETITAPSFPQFDQAELSDRIEVWLSALKQAAEDGSHREQGPVASTTVLK